MSKSRTLFHHFTTRHRIRIRIPIPIPLLLLFHLLLAHTLPSSSAQSAYCQGPPAAGCLNGLWNKSTCQCDCIPPFCHDAVFGQCAAAGICVAENPWRDCNVPGKKGNNGNCPWWVSLVRTESCVTGSEVRAI